MFVRCKRRHLGADGVTPGDAVSFEAWQVFHSVLHEVEKTSEELIYIPGDSLVACSFASYLGVTRSKEVASRFTHGNSIASRCSLETTVRQPQQASSTSSRIAFFEL